MLLIAGSKSWDRDHVNVCCDDAAAVEIWSLLSFFSDVGNIIAQFMSIRRNDATRQSRLESLLHV